jgi:hypothetical protein
MINPSLKTKQVFITIKTTRSLYFALTCVARSRHIGRTSLIHNIFQSFEFEPKPEIKYYKTGRTPSQLLDKYFFQFYPYKLPKDRGRSRNCTLGTNIIFRDNIRRLALMHGMTVNEFLVETLTQKMANEIADNPMMLRQIPYY